MKNTVLELINSNAIYKERAIDAICKDKVFVLVNENRIAAFTRTKKGAESYLSSWTDSYYDFDTKETVLLKKPLEIVEISAFEIEGYRP